jgi:hypothetical protein
MSPRHYVTVPDSDTEIVEEVTNRRMTKRGMKTTYKQVPIEEPLKEKAEQASRSRRTRKRQTELPEVEATPQEPTDTGDIDTHVFIEGHEDHIPEFDSEELQPQKMVWSFILCCHCIANGA